MLACYLCGLLDLQGEDVEVLCLLPQLLHLGPGAHREVCLHATGLQVVELLLEVGDLTQNQTVRSTTPI